MKMQAVADAKAAVAKKKSLQKTLATNTVAKAKAAVLKKKEAIAEKAAARRAEAEEASRKAAQRAKQKAEEARKAAAAHKKAAAEAAEKAKKEAEAKRAAEKEAVRAAEKAKKEAEEAAAALEKAAKRAEKDAAEAAAAAVKEKADKKAALQSLLDEKTSQIKFTPGDDSFDGLTLNNVKLEPPTDPKFWETAGDSGRFKEPAFDPKHAGAKKSFGCIVVEPDGRLWVIEPKGHFGGYEHTFPKGGANKGESNQQAAMREVFEESGLQVKIQGHLGDYEKTTSVTRYYIAKRVGGSPSLAGHETGTVKLVPFKDAKALLNKDIDKKILDDAEAMLKAPAKKAPKDAATVPPPPPAPKPSIPQPADVKFVKNLGGSTGAKLNIGPDGKKYVTKQGASSSHLANEALADDLYEAAGVKVANKIVGQDASGVSTKVAEFIDGKTLEQLKVSSPKQYAAAVKKLKKDFVTDALLGNWDVVGLNMDNVIVSKGNVYRIDNGGALLYRAQGKLKGTDNTPIFGTDVIELSSMRDKKLNGPAAEVYGTVTDKEISAQITKVLKKKGDILAAAAAKNKQVADLLEERFDSLVKWQQDYKKSLKAASKAKSGVSKVAAPSKASPPPSSTFPQQTSAAKEKALHELPAAHLSASSTIAHAYGAGESQKSKGWLHALKSMTTDRSMSWADRTSLGSELWKKVSSASKAAIKKWNGSSWGVRSQDIVIAKGGQPDSNWKAFVAGLQKMPTFQGGPLFRGMTNIHPGTAKRWVESGEWTSAPYEHHDGTGKAQYGHQSFDTQTSKAASFAGAGSSGKSVLIVLKDTKSARDGCGKIGLSDEHEVVVTPSARHSIDSYYWIYTGQTNSYIKNGTPVTTSQYQQIQKAQKKRPHGSFEEMHNDPSVLLVIEARET